MQYAIDSVMADVEVSDDPTVGDLAHPLITMLQVVEGFKQSGMYREAKYYAQHAATSAEQLSIAHPQLRCIHAVRQELKRVFDLPD